MATLFKTLKLSAAAACLLSTAAMAALPPLPEPVSNNAVAKVNLGTETYLVSLMGLLSGKEHNHVTAAAWALRLGEQQWQPLPDVPSSLALTGRLASIAVGLDRYVYLFGGYTVAADHSEVSAPDVYRLDVKRQIYTRLADMPVPVDDSVALVYQDRYIYLVSGWHNTGNVDLVQVYDTQTDSWFSATPFPGEPVFGQAAGIAGNRLLVCDGVKVAAVVAGKRQFKASRACYRGEIDDRDPSHISWQTIAHFEGPARYRMAAAGMTLNGNAGVLFVGGSINPYNFNGIGYDGVPAPASARADFFDFNSGTWQQLPDRTTATMDHRGLLHLENQVVTVGGMDSEQRVIDQVLSYPLPDGIN